MAPATQAILREAKNIEQSPGVFFHVLIQVLPFIFIGALSLVACVLLIGAIISGVSKAVSWASRKL